MLPRMQKLLLSQVVESYFEHGRGAERDFACTLVFETALVRVQLYLLNWDLTDLGIISCSLGINNNAVPNHKNKICAKLYFGKREKKMNSNSHPKCKRICEDLHHTV